jgi:hypothetical protein
MLRAGISRHPPQITTSPLRTARPRLAQGSDSHRSRVRSRSESRPSIISERVVSGNSIHLAPLRRAVIEVEKPAQPLRAAHGADGLRWGNANDQFVLKSLMVPFVMVVRDILTDRTPQMALAQRD